jgi:FAD/FMN-containing dehydrogenase
LGLVARFLPTVLAKPRRMVGPTKLRRFSHGRGCAVKRPGSIDLIPWKSLESQNASEMNAPPSASAAETGIAVPWEHLRAIAGAEHLRVAWAGDGVDGVQPQMVFEPNSETELAAALRFGDATGLGVMPRSGGTKTCWGNPPVRADLILSTARLNRVIEYAWADLTVNVEAGCTVQNLQNTLAEHGQRIAVVRCGQSVPPSAEWLHPLPRNIRTFTFAERDVGDASRAMLAVQDSWLTPTGLQARFTADAAPAVDVRFEGTDAGLAAQAVTLRKLATPAIETATSDAVWQAREELWSSAEPAAIAKFSVLPASVAETCGRIRHLADSLGVQWRAVVQGTGLGWLRLGFLADFLSHTVLAGFLTGVGIQVAVGELHGMLGLEKVGAGFFGGLFFTFKHLTQTHLPSVIISLSVLVVTIACNRIAAKIPGALFAVVAMIVVSVAFHLEKIGVKVVGEMASGLPRFGLPDVSWGDVPLVLWVAVSCATVILAQSAATSRAYALRHSEGFDENVDLVGLAWPMWRPPAAALLW